jgi:hypothetical protein
MTTSEPSHGGPHAAIDSHGVSETHRDNAWSFLNEGVFVQGHDVLVPWGCTEDALLSAFPQGTFWLSAGGRWPTSRLKILGFSGLWGFNFVSVPGRLFEVQLRNENPASSKRTYRRSRASLQRALGRPNLVDQGLLGQQSWAKGDVRVNNWLARGSTASGHTEVPVHHLSVDVLSLA